MVPITKPPSRPSRVLLGESRGVIRRLPNSRPVAEAAVSVTKGPTRTSISSAPPCGARPPRRTARAAEGEGGAAARGDQVGEDDRGAGGHPPPRCLPAEPARGATQPARPPRGRAGRPPRAAPARAPAGGLDRLVRLRRGLEHEG